jgi:hypothetical protein
LTSTVFIPEYNSREEYNMARDTVLAVRLSQIKRDKAEAIVQANGFASLAECIRHALEKVYSNEVIHRPWR